MDVYTANPLDTYDWLIPYMRPPDVPNDLGIGRDDLEKSLDVSATAVTMGGFGLAPGGPPFAAGGYSPTGSRGPETPHLAAAAGDGDVYSAGGITA